MTAIAGATTLLAHRMVHAGDADGGARVMADILRVELDLDVATCAVNRDGYSLNSLNGSVTTTDGDRYFFKFHAEEDGDRTAAEWYRAGLLADVGYPLERPVHVVTTPGRQVLLYRWRNDERMADACLRVEQQFQQPADPNSEVTALAGEQRSLDATVGALLVRTLHLADEAEVAAEPIHQLFHHRLVDPDRPDVLGARAERFYVHRSFALAGQQVPWDRLAVARWRVNGHLLDATFGDLLERTRVLMNPANPALRPAVVAHGDAHNANVWRTADGLTLFDPAFAGSHVPALLAEVKATFHNVWAHPFWLYHPSQCQFTANAQLEGTVLQVDTDWDLSSLRRSFLESKAELVWRPLLTALHERGWLHPDWRPTVRAALFACPTLVMNLRSGADASDRDAVTSLLGLTIAMLVGSEGSPLDDWFDAIAPAVAKPKASL